MRDRLKGHWSGIFYNKIFKTLDEEIFAPMYCAGNGRPNIPVNILVGLEILKELHGLTDEMLHESFLFNYTFHRALGIENIEDCVFELRTLYNFRANLAAYESRTGENLFLKVFKDGRDAFLKDIGLNTGMQRTDSVLIAANIKRMNRLMLFHKVFSNFVRGIQDLRIKLSAKYTDMIGEDEDSFAYRLQKERVPEKLREIAMRLHQLTERFKNSGPVTKLKSYQDAVRLIGEQCRIKEGRLNLRANKEIKSSSLQNPVDGDATYRRKNDKEYRGYATHATETCDPKNPVQIITHVETVRNNVDDAAVLADEIQHLKEETGLDTMIGDGAFASNDTRNACQDNDVQLVTSAIRGKVLEDDVLDSSAFSRDDSGLVSACPAGHRPRSQSRDKDGAIKANFDPAKCRGCSLNKKCIAYSSSGQSRIVIDYHRIWLDQRRELLKTEGYRNLCRRRPAVEGLMEKMKPKHLNGRTKFRGIERVSSRMILRGIGLNFRRYMAWLSDVLLHYCYRVDISWSGVVV